MKRISGFLVVLMIMLSLCLSGCSGNKNNTVSKAINELQNHWEELYADVNYDTDGYFEIKNTRIVYIKENDTDEFKDIDCIVEFVLYTDYYGSAPYYQHVGIDDTVVVFKDGSMKVQYNLINRYRMKYYSNDFSGFIESITDYSDKYNCVKKLK